MNKSYYVRSKFTNIASMSTINLLTLFLSTQLSVFFIMLFFFYFICATMYIPYVFFFFHTHSTTVFVIHYYCFIMQNGAYHKNKDGGEKVNEPPSLIKFKKLWLFFHQKLLLFRLPNNPYYSVMPMFKEHIWILKDFNLFIIVNTLDAL